MILITFNVPRLSSWPPLWSILENGPCALESDVLCIRFLLFLQMSARSTWAIVLFKDSISLLIFCLIVLFITDSRVFKAPTIISALAISPYSSNSVCVSSILGLFVGIYIQVC